MELINVLNAIANNDKLNCFTYGVKDDSSKKYDIVTLLNEVEEDDDLANGDAIVSPDGDIMLNGKLWAVRQDNLSEAGQAEFVEGFDNFMPKRYDVNADAETENPWCAPWTNNYSPSTYIKYGKTAKEMGEDWAALVKEEWEECCPENGVYRVMLGDNEVKAYPSIREALKAYEEDNDVKLERDDTIGLGIFRMPKGIMCYTVSDNDDLVKIRVEDTDLPRYELDDIVGVLTTSRVGGDDGWYSSDGWEKHPNCN